MFPEKTRFWGRHKNASTLLSSTCVFKYLKNKKFIHIRERPARRLTDADYQYITEIWETFGKHYEHELHILHPIFSISNILFILCR